MDHIILDKNMIIDSMLKLYEIIYKTNQYESELGTIDEQIKLIEDKKSKTLDLIFNGTLKKEELKVQFEHFEENIKSLKLTRQKISEQMNILNQNKSDVKKLKESIEDEVNGGVLEEFIRKFTDEIIVSKIDKNRYDIQLDIYLNLFAKVLIKTKGARHLESVDSNSMPYLLNQKYSSTESLQINRQRNNFTYNIYLEIL